ncbi:hypothetical protein SANTM175S_02131 [Streptomyces antimycoticus]
MVPRTATERTLAAVWARVLRVERVGVEDNFFSLGGDSILSIQLVSQARQAGLAVTSAMSTVTRRSPRWPCIWTPPRPRPGRPAATGTRRPPGNSR